MTTRAPLSTNPAALAAAAATSNSNQYNQQPTNNKMSQNPITSSSSSPSSSSNTSVVGLHYKISKKVGEGSFGVIFEGTNIINGVSVAVKFEPRKTDAPQLRDEYKTYKHLQGCDGIPNAYYFGQEGLHNILVIDLLGPSLEDLFDWCGRKFSVKTVVQVAIQMLNLIEQVHTHDLIYRDIKPDNFLIGRKGTPDENKVHLVDFGMAKQYRDPRTKTHIPYREKKSLSGTARYMSINTHLGREQLRRDDLEALGHVFFYFLRGQLPWQGLKAPTNKQKYEKIGDKKRTTPAVALCEGLPRQFAEYLDSVRSLPFDAEPHYEEYRMLLLSALDDLGVHADGVYDWMHLNGGKGYDVSINKKPNLHGYGHPNPPNERERRNRDQRRSRHHHQNHQQQLQQQQNSNPNGGAGGVVGSQNGTNQAVNNNYSQSQSFNNLSQQRDLSAAQLHQQKLQHLVNRPLPPIKQESQKEMITSNNYESSPMDRSNQYDQQKAEEPKSFWSKLCCQ